MGNAAHHRASIAKPLTPSARAVATFPAAPPLAPSKARAVPPQLGRYGWQGTGRPVPKWTRYGYWDETGTELTVTRIL